MKRKQDPLKGKRLTVSVWWGIKDWGPFHVDSGHHRAFIKDDEPFPRFTLCRRKIIIERARMYPISLKTIPIAFIFGDLMCKRCKAIEKKLIKRGKIWLPPSLEFDKKIRIR